MESIRYEIEVDTDAPEKYRTVLNTVAPGTDLSGVLVRKKVI